MNILNIIITGAILVSLAVVIIVITRSFKNVDKKIVEDINSGEADKKIGFVKKIRQVWIAFIGWTVKGIRNNAQKIYHWTIKEKRKNKSDVIKAKDELMIEEDKIRDDKKSVDEIIKDEQKKLIKTDTNVQQNKILPNKLLQDKSINLDGGDILKEISVEENIVTMDSVSLGDDISKQKNKQSFIRGLFKSRKSKKSIDIKKGTGDSSEEWSLSELDEADVDNNKELSNGGMTKNKTGNVRNDAIIVDKEDNKSDSITKFTNTIDSEDEDDMLGVDRQILENKILQKIDKNPKNLNNYHELGELYIKMKKYNDALEVFKYILTASPRNVKAKRQQGKIKLLKRLEK